MGKTNEEREVIRNFRENSVNKLTTKLKLTEKKIEIIDNTVEVIYGELDRKTWSPEEYSNFSRALMSFEVVKTQLIGEKEEIEESISWEKDCLERVENDED